MIYYDILEESGRCLSFSILKERRCAKPVTKLAGGAAEILHTGSCSNGTEQPECTRELLFFMFRILPCDPRQVGGLTPCTSLHRIWKTGIYITSPLKILTTSYHCMVFSCSFPHIHKYSKSDWQAAVTVKGFMAQLWRLEAEPHLKSRAISFANFDGAVPQLWQTQKWPWACVVCLR